MEDSRRDLKDDNLNSLLPDVQVDRRGFIAGCIAAGFAVSANPVLAQAIKTPMDGLEGGDGKVGDIPIYHAVPQKGGKRPVVIVIPEIWGLHEYQKDICRRLAKAGYFGVSLDPFFRSGDLSKVADIKEVLAGANRLSVPWRSHGVDVHRAQQEGGCRRRLVRLADADPARDADRPARRD